ncbi:MAG: pyridoxamine 5'-phosphate oxidase family protein [Spirochaetes bacterium]|nr:pyridoxamine 5'-phosphate oxidase family protein [Spirochaetota bacterium]MBU1080121.1 pyridoxamine 5'-phosphate oxidase family protein [Spirochaetota bacterium]
MTMKDRFDEGDLPNFEPDGKVGLMATVDPDGLPHITLITAMQALDTRRLVFGQFCEGRGKRYAEERRKVGFLFLSLDRRVWRGTASWTGKSDSGPEHAMMNKKPMWRYNSYFGIHTVHYLDVVSASGAEPIAMGRVVAGFAKGALAKAAIGPRLGPAPHPGAMNPWTSAFVSRPGNLKFAAYVGADGYPRVVPQLAASCSGGGRAYLPGTEYPEEVAGIPDGSSVALFAMALSMEDVLVRGRFRKAGSGGFVDVDWVYNSMPPVAERIYPPLRLSEKVTAF